MPTYLIVMTKAKASDKGAEAAGQLGMFAGPQPDRDSAPVGGKESKVSHVKGHVRRTSSGKMAVVKRHERRVFSPVKPWPTSRPRRQKPPGPKPTPPEIDLSPPKRAKGKPKKRTTYVRERASDRPHKGEIVSFRGDSRIYEITKVGRRQYFEDGLSFGLGIDDGYEWEIALKVVDATGADADRRLRGIRHAAARHLRDLHAWAIGRRSGVQAAFPLLPKVDDPSKAPRLEGEVIAIDGDNAGRSGYRPVWVLDDDNAIYAVRLLGYDAPVLENAKVRGLTGTPLAHQHPWDPELAEEIRHHAKLAEAKATLLRDPDPDPDPDPEPEPEPDDPVARLKQQWRAVEGVHMRQRDDSAQAATRNAVEEMRGRGHTALELYEHLPGARSAISLKSVYEDIMDSRAGFGKFNEIVDYAVQKLKLMGATEAEIRDVLPKRHHRRVFGGDRRRRPPRGSSGSSSGRKATFTKLRNGQWGVRVEGAAPEPGDTIRVSKRNGTTSDVTVRRVLWSGDDDDLHIVSLAKGTVLEVDAIL